MHFNSFPQASRSSLSGLSYSQIRSIDSTICDESILCCICLEHIEIGSIIKVLPGCYHRFHTHCIEPWLLRSIYCPYCRGRVETI